uniref:Uncharacterized protein n=1 Tax=Arundo donax TaxID=35708 RepID=A0A0A9GEX0_ARUDO
MFLPVIHLLLCHQALEQRMAWDSIEHAYLQAKELDAPFGWQHFLSEIRTNFAAIEEYL